MAVYAIADLHLPARQKPMDVFGPHWKDHFQRIREDWLARVAPGDLVPVEGDGDGAWHIYLCHCRHCNLSSSHYQHTYFQSYPVCKRKG